MGIWTQILTLCSAIIGGIEGRGKGKDRDEETKTAAVRCLRSLLRPRNAGEGQSHKIEKLSRAQARLADIQAHVRTASLIPVLGQTIDSLLKTAESQNLPLQRLSLQVLRDIVSLYAPDYFVPTVLPGVISSATKIALGIPGGKGWAKGESVAGALGLMQDIIVRAVGDEVCLREGAVRKVRDLEDLVDFSEGASLHPDAGVQQPYSTARTPAWLRGTSSQLHIALNTITPLVSHPTPSALLALSDFSSTVLVATSLTLPQAQPLLLSFLLSLSNSPFPGVSTKARQELTSLLASPIAHSLLQTLMQNTRDNLAALPRMLPSQSDSKVEHVAGLIEAVCRLAAAGDEGRTGAVSIAVGVGKLLGPTGGIEKWGWGLLSALEFAQPPISPAKSSAALLMLEGKSSSEQCTPFPQINFKSISSPSTRSALERVFRSLGRASGETCIFAVEWFANIGTQGTERRAIAALWCACRLLEGVGNVSLDPEGSDDAIHARHSTRLQKLARSIARSVAELWESEERSSPQSGSPAQPEVQDDDILPVEHVKGIVSVRSPLDVVSSRPQPTRNFPSSNHSLRKSLALQLLSITSGILQARFAPLLIHTLYPVLHSLVSFDSHVSSTALAALDFITSSMSYASPANLLLSNFDYALDAVSRRLTRRWLDVDAAKVLSILVRLVGSDVVQRAGDVVEECFDRLDEYHGYDIIVEGLVEVLIEVIKVIEFGEDAAVARQEGFASKETRVRDDTRVDGLLEWVRQRHAPSIEEEDTTDYGPAPREAWGPSKAADQSEEAGHPQAQAIEEDPSPSPTQILTKQIVSRSLYFLTHGSPVIRARILKLLSSSVPVLPESALMPSIHDAWPFVLNRLRDEEPFVVSAAASLVESLATNVGSFMTRRLWDDVWPIFRTMLDKLNAADSTNALARRGNGAVGTESAYTHSHRLYISILKTMLAAVKGVQIQDSPAWQVILAFRRFLHSRAHEELQACARELYVAIGANNEDAVWLALSSSVGEVDQVTSFLHEPKWDISANVDIILERLVTVV
jgi:TELO2-interacting protein 1